MTLETILTTVAIVSAIVALIYLFAVNTSYFTITAIAIRQLRRQIALETYEPVGALQANRFLPGVAIVVPAYNEEKVILDSVSSLLALEYPNQEVVVVNDGSTDDTLAVLLDRFDLRRVDAEYPVSLNCEPVRNIYRAVDEDLVVIDKENAGKADALNAGLFFTDQPLFCAVDADSIIERGGLQRVVEPFLRHPDEMVATGGSIRIANGSSFKDGELQSVSLPRSSLLRFQVIEYLRAFLLGRIGLSNLRSLLIISGAFGLFRTETLREIGGYDTESITEDMELVVRLHRYLIETNRKNAVTFLPQPVAWTEAPDSLSVLSRQRRRWFRGMIDTLVKHRGAMGRRRYGVIGLFALPFFLFIETIGPLVEGAGYVLIPIFFLAGLLDFPIFLSFIVVAIGLGALVSGLAVVGELITYRRYEKPQEAAILLLYSVLESFLYRPWRAFVSWRGLGEYLAGDRSWGRMQRTGFDNRNE